MIGYRLYCLEAGRIVGSEVFDAEDDLAAIDAARKKGHSVDCELWCDTRLVAFIPPPPFPEI